MTRINDNNKTLSIILPKLFKVQIAINTNHKEYQSLDQETLSEKTKV